MLQVVVTLFFALCGFGAAPPENDFGYRWSNVTPAAEFPEGYNYPVFVLGNKMVAMNTGAWTSQDGKTWQKTPLPDSGLNSAYLRYVQFNGAIYALGSMRGDYRNFAVRPKILWTRDLENWNGDRSENLPQRIFYAAVVFDNKIWMLGGYDGKNYLNDVWNSADGIHWTRVLENAPWSPRTGPVAAVFKDEIWLLGGGVIDGDPKPDKAAEREVWASKDGKSWRRVEADLKRKWRGTPVVFDGKLWLVGANRGGTFESAVWVTENGSNWKELPAPWSPRGAVAAWVFGDRIYMTGGKSSHVENGETRFVYSNDVWAMGRTSAKGE